MKSYVKIVLSIRKGFLHFHVNLLQNPLVKKGHISTSEGTRCFANIVNIISQLENIIENAATYPENTS